MDVVVEDSENERSENNDEKSSELPDFNLKTSLFQRNSENQVKKARSYGGSQ